jgi:DNA-binding MarR family transcriptional regulator/energy-coupling factor transporter ATP-binding protein EcfA2
MSLNSHLDTRKAQALLYQNNFIQITVMGGIRLDHLERMKVTLVVKHETKTDLAPTRQPLDLYNDDQVSALVRKLAERLEASTQDLYRIIYDLTEKLEQYRLSEIDKKEVKRPKKKELSISEKKEAKAYLTKKNLMERTLSDIGKSGVIGEELNRLLMYLCYTSRKRAKPLHIICLGSSGSGKTHLQETVSALIPDEDKREVTTLSNNALYYFGERGLENKLLLIEDLDGAEDVLYPLRELQSKQKISKEVAMKDSQGKIKTEHIVVYGPVATSACTTKERLYEDNANRAFLLYLDNSESQDKAIMNYQRSRSAGSVNLKEETELKKLFQNCQRLLEQVTVKNPYANQLIIPHEVFKQRRTNELYLSLIETVTFYHQFQRAEQTDKLTGEIYIETALEDIHWANKLICEVLLRKSDELSGAQRAFLEELKDYLKSKDSMSFYTKDLRYALRMSPATVKRHVFSLEEYGYLKKIRGSKHKGYEYELLSLNDYDLLKERIYQILESNLEKIEAKTSQNPALAAG